MKILTHSIQLLLALVVLSSFAPENPDVGEREQILFKINRSRDADEIWYIVNLDKTGVPNHEAPIKAYWVRKTGNNEIEPLTWIQNKYAYGVRVIQSYNEQRQSLKFRFVSYEGQTFELRKMANGKFKVITSIENKVLVVSRIFVQIDGDSFWEPSVPYVKFTGYDIASSSLVSQTIKPKL